MASNSNGNRINVPQAKEALSNMKYEIARELGVHRSTVSRTLHRAQARLRHYLQYSL